jgi:hypothetical protein
VLQMARHKAGANAGYSAGDSARVGARGRREAGGSGAAGAGPVARR